MEEGGEDHDADLLFCWDLLPTIRKDMHSGTTIKSNGNKVAKRPLSRGVFVRRVVAAAGHDSPRSNSLHERRLRETGAMGNLRREMKV